ncbi:EAL domain-containing protein [Massilia sp. CMS3.1]|uniref:sensor domain-containing protein n=1 Tax=Massilia sp. CMS3.1 TaxID=3373083 RepID=UPI003EE80DFB
MRGTLLKVVTFLGAVLYSTLSRKSKPRQRRANLGKSPQYQAHGRVLSRRALHVSTPSANGGSVTSDPREQALFNALVENCSDAIWLKDTAGVYQACNRAAAEMYGWLPRDIVGKTDAELFLPQVARHLQNIDSKVLETKVPVVDEQIFHQNGEPEPIILDVVVSTVVQPDAKVIGILGIGRNVAVRRRKENKIREQEALLQEMSNLAQIGGWELDVLENKFSWTSELIRIYEFNENQNLSFESLCEPVDGTDRVILEKALANTLSKGEPADFQIKLLLPNGTAKWVRVHWRAATEERKVTRIWGIAQDLTDSSKLVESLRMAELIYSTNLDAILITDDQATIVDANPAFLHMTGYTKAEVLGRFPQNFRVDSDNTAAFALIGAALREHGTWKGQVQLRHKDGKSIDTYVDIEAIREPGNVNLKRAVHLRDLSEQISKDAEIWRHANFDSLTGLPNRSLLLDRLGQLIETKRADNDSLGILCIDLDRFAAVNDLIGHANGDKVLVEVAKRLHEAVTANGTLARIAGDRFVVVLVDTQSNIEQVALTIIDSFSIPFEAGESVGGVHTSTSIGIALYPEDAPNANGLLSIAEQAMTLAKRKGGNRFHYHAPLQQQAAMVKVRLINELRQAISRSQIHMYYQPIIDARTGYIRKAEALLRWNHPQIGIISPAQFIPLAEESGLIVHLGDWVMDEAISSVQRWQKEYDLNIELSVNQSPAQFVTGSNATWIKHLIIAGLPKHSITVEITESMLVDDSGQMRTSLKLLQENGAKISLDDFGTGFSALSYLKLFNVNYLKIDKSFIHNIEQDSSDKALTQAIIDLAHKLNIETIAEGVETKGQQDILMGFGCDYVQGYLYSKPVTREAFEDLLQNQLRQGKPTFAYYKNSDI